MSLDGFGMGWVIYIFPLKKKIKNSIIVVFVTVVAVVAFAVIVVVVVVVSSVHWASLDALECILYFPPGMIGNSLLLFRTWIAEFGCVQNNRVSNTTRRKYT